MEDGEIYRYRDFAERHFYKLVLREAWCKEELPAQVQPLRIPLTGIVLSFTEGNRCKTRQECEERVKQIQQESRDHGHPDTQFKFNLHLFSFLVGGDGYIYEALGWHHFLPDQVEYIKGGEKLFGRSIEVAYIDKNTNQPTEPMQRGLSRIITMGLTEQLLIDDFSFYCRSDEGIEFLETRDKAKEKRWERIEKRKERTNPNYRRRKREKIVFDGEEIKKIFEKQGAVFPEFVKKKKSK